MRLGRGGRGLGGVSGLQRRKEESKRLGEELVERRGGGGVELC